VQANLPANPDAPWHGLHAGLAALFAQHAAG